MMVQQIPVNDSRVLLHSINWNKIITRGGKTETLESQWRTWSRSEISPKEAFTRFHERKRTNEVVVGGKCDSLAFSRPSQQRSGASWQFIGSCALRGDDAPIHSQDFNSLCCHSRHPDHWLAFDFASLCVVFPHRLPSSTLACCSCDTNNNRRRSSSTGFDKFAFNVYQNCSPVHRRHPFTFNNLLPHVCDVLPLIWSP